MVAMSTSVSTCWTSPDSPQHCRHSSRCAETAAASTPANSYRFDDARNWTFLSKLLDDDDAQVQYVFVARALSDRLLAHAEASGAPPWLIERAKAVMFEPRHGNRHQSHFHVRIYCPKEDLPYCQDRPPYFAWYGGLLPPGVSAPVPSPPD